MLIHETLRNTTLSTDYKVVDVDSKGLITGLTEEQEKEVAKLNGFTFIQDKKEEPKKQEPKKQEPKKQEPKKEEPKKEEPKKTTTRKTTPKKTTTTKKTSTKQDDK